MFILQVSWSYNINVIFNANRQGVVHVRAQYLYNSTEQSLLVATPWPIDTYRAQYVNTNQHDDVPTYRGSHSFHVLCAVVIFHAEVI